MVTSVIEYSSHSDASGATAATNGTLSCLLHKLRYQRKSHANYNKISQHAEIPFTIFKQPYWTMHSHYIMRKMWDVVYEKAYPGSLVSNVTMPVWIETAWWRHNLFVKMLATDTDLIWSSRATTASALVPARHESDSENALGEQSTWLQTALQRLEIMPVFGLHHRLRESFELFGFRLCFPVSMKYFNKKRFPQANVQVLVDRHNQLDNLLLQRAEARFDEMIRDMRQKKAKGILCDLGAVLDRPGLEMGLQCAAVNSESS